jgi:flagellin
MSLTVQTNIASLIAQNNLNVNSTFMTKTIERLSSGYRINSSADDAAGLVIANQFRSNVAEMTQGISNANDGVSTLQIVDGGLNNISTILDRLKTLATQSASGTFSGDRSTLNNEYQTLLGEISRQAANIGLNAGGSNNTTLQVFIGGTSVLANAQVSVKLSGAANQVDAAGLGLSTSNIQAAGTELTGGGGNTVLLNNTAGTFTGTQAFTFNVQGSSGPVTVNYNGAGVATGDGSTAVSKLNAAMQAAGVNGITASIASDGTLQFSGGVAFSVTAAAPTGAGLATGATFVDNNTGLYAFNEATAPNVSAGTEAVTVTNGQGSVNLSFTAANGGANANAINYMNTQLNSLGIYAVANAAGTGYSLQSSSTFTINKTAAATTGGVFAGAAGSVALTNTSPSSSGASAQAAITAINNAVAQLGKVQGSVGAGENDLNYAIGLATSQISSFSAAESRIRDADMASEAANLTKAQILQQSSIAAMAQANSAPQAVLALLK